MPLYSSNSEDATLICYSSRSRSSFWIVSFSSPVFAGSSISINN